MNPHNPFEEWILQDEPLNEAQESALNQHVAACGQCHELQLNWQHTHQQIKTITMATPAPGFSQRWQASLPQRRMRQQAQVRRFFKYLIGINLLSFVGLIATFVLGTSPLDLVSGLLHGSVSIFLYAREAQNLALAALHSVPLFVPVVFWILISTGFCLAVLTWGFSMWRYFYKGVSAK
jgi:hypothetical protein